MEFRIFPFLIFFSFTPVFTQNLIPNGDFEDVNICEQYKEGCFPAAWRSTSLKLASYQQNTSVSAAGKRSVSLLYVDRARNFDRKFIQTYLLCPLIKGEEYNLTFDYKSLLPRAKSIGFYFSDTMIFDVSNLALEELPAIAVAINKEFPNQWKSYSHTFKATKNANVLIVGNFHSDEKTTQFELNKKEQKKLNKSYEPKNRIFIDLDNLKLISKLKLNDFDLNAKRQLIYADKIRHSFAESKKMIEDTSTSVYEIEDTEFVETQRKEKKKTEVPIKLTTGLNLLDGVEFESGTTILTSTSTPKLEAIVQYLIMNKLVKLKIIGYTDNVGNEIDNQRLSEDRANQVRLFLKNNGIDSQRLSSKGMGENDPIANNKTEKGRQRNRRVVVEVYY